MRSWKYAFFFYAFKHIFNWFFLTYFFQWTLVFFFYNLLIYNYWKYFLVICIWIRPSTLFMSHFTNYCFHLSSQKFKDIFHIYFVQCFLFIYMLLIFILLFNLLNLILWISLFIVLIETAKNIKVIKIWILKYFLERLIN